MADSESTFSALEYVHSSSHSTAHQVIVHPHPLQRQTGKLEAGSRLIRRVLPVRKIPSMSQPSQENPHPWVNHLSREKSHQWVNLPRSGFRLLIYTHSWLSLSMLWYRSYISITKTMKSNRNMFFSLPPDVEEVSGALGKLGGLSDSPAIQRWVARIHAVTQSWRATSSWCVSIIWIWWCHLVNWWFVNLHATNRILWYNG